MIEDYEALQEFFKSLNNENLKLPEYIPDGYKFESAQISFFLPDGIDYEELEPVYREEKFGNIYEKYILPESSETVMSVHIRYVKGSRNFGSSINYSINFASANAVGFGGTSEALREEPVLLDMPQFEHSMIAAYGNTKKPNWYFSAVNSFEPFNVSGVYAVSKTWREYEDEAFWRITEEIGTVMYRIMSYEPREEVIKMAESIK